MNAAKHANVGRFIFVSFRPMRGISFPLADAKAQVENAVADLNFTVIRASWFMEVWLSPALGFDYANATTRIYGPGTSPISWVSFFDVAEMCAVVVRHPAAQRRTIEFGGPDALSPLQVVAIFEKLGAKPFRFEHVPETAGSPVDRFGPSLQEVLSKKLAIGTPVWTAAYHEDWASLPGQISVFAQLAQRFGAGAIRRCTMHSINFPMSPLCAAASNPPNSSCW